MHLNKDLREFVELLNSTGVDYLVVGAFALAWHGYPRFTADIDILVRPTEENAEAVLKVLRAFGFGSLNVKSDDLMRPGQIVQLGVKPNRIDIITSIDGVEFDQAWGAQVPGTIEGLPVPFISREDLIRNKSATGRPGDQKDVEELRRRNTERLK